MSARYGLSSRLRIAALRACGAQIAPRCRLVGVRVPRNPWDIAIETGVAIDDGVVLLTTGARSSEPRIRIGRNVYINRYAIFDASLSIIVESHAMIGPYCYITDHDHGTSPHELVQAQPLIEAPVVIGENAWLGARVTVLKGVTIGAGAVVGAGSVVTKSVPPGARVAGVPARPLLRSHDRLREIGA